MKIKYFSWIKNITKKNSESVSHEKIKNVNALKKYLCIKYPKLEQHIIKEDIIKIAINLEYVTTNKKFAAKDEIALFPPVSGG